MTDFLSGTTAYLQAFAKMQMPVQFWLGYVALMLVPGPNSFLIATVTAVRGFRGALPLVVSISLGASSLALIIGVTIASAADLAGVKSWLPQVSAVMLAAVGWRITNLRLPACDPGLEASDRSGPDLIVGYTCGLTNPVTAVYFSSQILIGAPLESASSIVMLGMGVAACAIVIKLAIASILAVPWVRNWVRAKLFVFKLGAIVVLVVMGALSLARF